ncbi:MAG: PDDEXK nuclease domain-containing protein [Bacteroidota bacterium]
MQNLPTNKKYQQLLSEVKQRIQQAQVKAAVAANQELLLLYWEIGRLIVERQAKGGWGANVIDQLSIDLKKSFPNMKGFSPRNLGYMKRFAKDYADLPILQQPVAKIGWGHNIVLFHKCKNEKERFWYAQKALENGWSRDVMVHQIEWGLYERQGKAITNFAKTLPSPQSDMAQQTLKDPYILDFLNLREDALERELEEALVKHITKFLLELGKGFAFVGRQYYLEVGGDEFFIDLLFYHLELRCYVVIDLKVGKFKPEYAGKMNFYLSAIDDIVKKEQDEPSIGIILCKSKNEVTAEYSLRSINRPIGISEYELTKAVPENLQSQLPAIEDLERELKDIEVDNKDHNDTE